MKNKELKEKIIDSIDANHIWINAFSIINPDRETCESIGLMIINMLKDNKNLLPSYYKDKKSENVELTDIQKLTSCLYLYVNAS